MDLKTLYKEIDNIKQKHLEEHITDVNNRTAIIFKKINNTLVAGITLQDNSLHEIFCKNIRPKIIDEYNHTFEILKENVKKLYDFKAEDFSFATVLGNEGRVNIKIFNKDDSDKNDNNTFVSINSSSITAIHQYIPETEREDRWNRPGYMLDLTLTFKQKAITNISLEGSTQVDNSSSYSKATTVEFYREKNDLQGLSNAFLEINEKIQDLLLNKKNEFDLITKKRENIDNVINKLGNISNILNNPSSFVETRKIDEKIIKSMKTTFAENLNFFEGLSDLQDLDNAFQLLSLTTDINIKDISGATPYVEKRGRPAATKKTRR